VIVLSVMAIWKPVADSGLAGLVRARAAIMGALCVTSFVDVAMGGHIVGFLFIQHRDGKLLVPRALRAMINREVTCPRFATRSHGRRSGDC